MAELVLVMKVGLAASFLNAKLMSWALSLEKLSKRGVWLEAFELLEVCGDTPLTSTENEGWKKGPNEPVALSLDFCGCLAF